MIDSVEQVLIDLLEKAAEIPFKGIIVSEYIERLEKLKG